MKKFLYNQAIPLAFTFLIFGIMWAFLHGEILVLNHITPIPIAIRILPADMLVGFAIYLQTSIDFAIFIAHLMRTHPGWKNRIAIECGTAAGNALGTCTVLALWSLFRDIEWVLALMIIIASIVLLKLAQDGLEHAQDEDKKYPAWFRGMVKGADGILARINKILAPLISWMPHATLNVTKQYNWIGLLFFAGSIPFILGLDDFAGYVPLFNVVHIYGFALGILAGHLVLNIFLFLAPNLTIKTVKQPIVSFIGSMALVALALWGMKEVVKIVVETYIY
ncbi:MAG: hypothetical protein JWM56_1377 [Candidatus Peribacteria bacterium]|nr:hypothetical protein [Candidatus Peribacteria bacterium]